MKLKWLLIIGFLGFSIMDLNASDASKEIKKDEEKENQFISVEKAEEITAKEKYLKEKSEQAEYLRNKESIQYYKIRNQWKKKGSSDSKLEDKIIEEEQKMEQAQKLAINQATQEKPYHEKSIESQHAFEKAMSSELIVDNQKTAREFLVKNLGLDIEVVDMLEMYESRDLIVFKAVNVADLDESIYQVENIVDQKKLDEWEYNQQIQSYRKDQIVTDDVQRKFERDSSLLFKLEDEKEFNLADKEDQ